MSVKKCRLNNLGNSSKRPKQEAKSREHFEGIPKDLKQKLEDAFERPDEVWDGDLSESALNPRTSCFQTSKEKKESNAKKASRQTKAKATRNESAGVLSQDSASFKGKSLSSFQNDGVEIRPLKSKSRAKGPNVSPSKLAKLRLFDPCSSNLSLLNNSIEVIKTQNTLNLNNPMKKTNSLNLPGQGDKIPSHKESYLSRKTVVTKHRKDLTSETENSLGALGEVESKQVDQHQNSANYDIQGSPTVRSKEQPKKKNSLLLHFPDDLRTLATDKNWYNSIKRNNKRSNTISENGLGKPHYRRKGRMLSVGVPWNSVTDAILRDSIGKKIAMDSGRASPDSDLIFKENNLPLPQTPSCKNIRRSSHNVPDGGSSVAISNEKGSKVSGHPKMIRGSPMNSERAIMCPFNSNLIRAMGLERSPGEYSNSSVLKKFSPSCRLTNPEYNLHGKNLLKS
jgi:hypothetical protein